MCQGEETSAPLQSNHYLLYFEGRVVKKYPFDMLKYKEMSQLKISVENGLRLESAKMLSQSFNPSQLSKHISVCLFLDVVCHVMTQRVVGRIKSNFPSSLVYITYKETLVFYILLLNFKLLLRSLCQ